MTTPPLFWSFSKTHPFCKRRLSLSMHCIYLMSHTFQTLNGPPHLKSFIKIIKNPPKYLFTQPINQQIQTNTNTWYLYKYLYKYLCPTLVPYFYRLRLNFAPTSNLNHPNHKHINLCRIQPFQRSMFIVLVGFQAFLGIHLVSTNITFILQFQMLDLNVVSQNSHSGCFVLALWAWNCRTLVYAFNMARKYILDGE